MLPVRDSASHGDDGAAPCGGTVHAVVENIVPDHDITDSRLLVPIASVTLEQDRRARRMEGVLLDHNLTS